MSRRSLVVIIRVFPIRRRSMERGRGIIVPVAVLGDPLLFRSDVVLGSLGGDQTLILHYFFLTRTGFLGIDMGLIHTLLIINLEAEDLLELSLNPLGP